MCTKDRESVNCVPLLEVSVEGTPNLDIQVSIKTRAHVSEEVEFIGTASGHLEVLSIMVRRCVKPRLGGRGPTRST